MADPAYHRYLIFGAADEARQRQLGRDLEPHEAQGLLPWPQREAMERCERAIADKRGEVLTVLSSRQTMKGENEAHLASRALAIFAGVPGSVWVRTAPTYRPQIVNSKLRLEKFTALDPLIAGRARNREGFIVQVGHAQVHFLSGGASANVLGATASIALSVDEAHKIDRNKFDEELAPFTARTNAPTVLWGVAADKLDLLQEYRDLNEGTDRLLRYPADVWCALSKAYAGHYAARVRKLGEDHPIILTQYRLIPVEGMGSYLNAPQRASLFSGDHPRLEAPRPGMAYAMVVDCGGQSELDASSEQVRAEEPDRDSTVALVVEWDPYADREPYPMARVVAGEVWTGQDHMAVLPDLRRMAERWGIRSGCGDANGVGEAPMMALAREFPCFVAYKGTSPSVSDDCYDLLARINTGRVRWWKADPASDPLLKEAQQQARHTSYAIANHERMKLLKPHGVGSSGLHIDVVKALTYLRTAMQESEMDLAIRGLMAEQKHLSHDLALRDDAERGRDARG